MWRSTRLKISLLYNNTSEAIRQGEKELFLRFFRGFLKQRPLYINEHARDRNEKEKCDTQKAKVTKLFRNQLACGRAPKSAGT